MPRTPRTDAERALRNLGRAILLFTFAAALLATSIIFERNPPKNMTGWNRQVAGTFSGYGHYFSPESSLLNPRPPGMRSNEILEFTSEVLNERARTRHIAPFASHSTPAPLAMELRELNDGRVLAVVLRKDALDVFEVSSDLRVTSTRVPLPTTPATSGTMVLMREETGDLVAVYGSFGPPRVVAVSIQDGSLRWELPLCSEVGVEPSWVFSVLPVRHPNQELAAAWVRGGLGQLIFNNRGNTLYTSCQFGTKAVFWVPEPRGAGDLDVRGLLIVESPHWTILTHEQVDAFARDGTPVREPQRIPEPLILGSALGMRQAGTMRGIRLTDAIDDSDVNGTELLFRLVDSAAFQAVSFPPRAPRGFNQSTSHLAIGFPTRRQAPVAGVGGDDLIGTRRGVIVPARNAHARTSRVSDGSQHPMMNRSAVVRRRDPALDLIRPGLGGGRMGQPSSADTTGTLTARPRPERSPPVQAQFPGSFEPVQAPPGEMMSDATSPIYSLGTRIADIQSIQRTDGRWIVVAIDSQDACTLFFTLEVNQVSNLGEGGGS